MCSLRRRTAAERTQRRPARAGRSEAAAEPRGALSTIRVRGLPRCRPGPGCDSAEVGPDRRPAPTDAPPRGRGTRRRLLRGRGGAALLAPTSGVARRGAIARLRVAAPRPDPGRPARGRRPTPLLPAPARLGAARRRRRRRRPDAVGDPVDGHARGPRRHCSTTVGFRPRRGRDDPPGDEPLRHPLRDTRPHVLPRHARGRRRSRARCCARWSALAPAASLPSRSCRRPCCTPTTGPSTC